MEEVALEAAPRTLDVQQFAKARASELLSLHQALKASSAGVASVPRHLRRRTSSYNRRRALAGLFKKKRQTQAQQKKKNGNNKRKTPPVKPFDGSRKQPKPDDGAGPSSTAAHLNDGAGKADDIGPSSTVADHHDDVAGSPHQEKKRLCRRLRRRLEFKSGGPLISRDGTRRLTTHLWHAKRFTMAKLWDHYVPLGLPGRGHGSRAVLNWAKEAAILQDASFYVVLQLQGIQEGILQLFKLVLEFRYNTSSPDESELSGDCHATAILHHVGQPSRVIAPVVLSWKPVIPKPGSSSFTTEQSTEREVWLWVHPAAFNESFQCLQMVSGKLNERFRQNYVRCFSRRGDLACLDILGTKSSEVLQKVFFPVDRNENGDLLKVHKFSELVRPDKLAEQDVIYLEIFDPRLDTKERCLLLASSSASFNEHLVSNLEEKSTHHECEEGFGICINDSAGFDPKNLTADLQSNNEKKSWKSMCSLHALNSLWAMDINSHCWKHGPPVSEKFLSELRHLDRLSTFGLLDDVRMSRMLGKMKALTKKCICPIMLLRHRSQKPSACGWSIILPMSWVSAFWVPIIFAGGHVIGLRERHWLCTDAGLPFFPSDFPDSPAYTALKAAEFLQEAEVLDRTSTNSTMYTSSPIVDSYAGLPFSNIPVSDTFTGCACDLHIESGKCKGSTCVARSTTRLLKFLETSEKKGLLLFPEQMKSGKGCQNLSFWLQEGKIAWRVKKETEMLESMKGDGCLLRCLVRPHQKGVVEVGAMLYAPIAEDYVNLCTRDDYKNLLVASVSANGQSILRKHLGFVTSQAPRGSQDSAAVAFCNAVLLAQIRARQWVETKWQNDEIFLMFHNSSSTKFRPAFASIVLEKGPDI